MIARLSDLTPAQILLLERLDDEWDHADSVGVRMTTLSDRTLVTAFGLVDLELATVSFGWRGAGWVRLSEAGRRIVEEGLEE